MNSITHGMDATGGSIYTLAESGTGVNEFASSRSVVRGRGVEIHKNLSLKARPQRKVISQRLVLALVDVAREKRDSNRVQQYWNTYNCLNKVVVADGRMYGDYCKNRFCTVCTAIRKADIINRYYPVLSKWDDAYFVTLTVRSCKAKDLRMFMEGFIRAMQKIIR